MKLADVSVAPRFCGPPGSANGGYVAGLLAGFAPEHVEVRLLKPPPLDRPLAVVAGADGALELRDGDVAVASARGADLELEVPVAPGAATAAEAARDSAALRAHAFPGCFVCGPARASDDGLRIFAGPLALGVEGRRGVAAAWTPDESLAGTRGRVRPEFLWAALDCPGYFALEHDAGPRGPAPRAVEPGARVLLLGSFACRIDRSVAVGETCVVVGWPLGSEGRRHRAATALYGADGACVARALATWVEPRSAVTDRAPA